MKTLTKLLATGIVLTVSVAAFAHMGGGYSGGGFQHPMMGNGNMMGNAPMMNTDSPQYKAMLELHNNPEAMQAWMQSMHDNPQAMQEWMNQMHNDNYANQGGGFGCQGNRFNNNQNSNGQ
ncbi:hypothetical protein [Vibrio sp.]|uniref:hypothetical protein n=1 Tax=Vibrio sp. TaxID=678 RepID=UPI003D14F02E